MLSHGSGGSMMHELIRELFFEYFDNPLLNLANDSAILPGFEGLMAFTTDSFVVDPVFFPGGDIGKLAVCGTINDLVAVGAKPYCLSAGFIIEEGFPIHDLELIVSSMATEAAKAGIFIAAGDTKVVEKGKCDKLFINTSGIGILPGDKTRQPNPESIRAGDQVIITGCIGDHGMAVMAARNQLEGAINIQSDCAPLNLLLHGITEHPGGIKCMRDPTRGGVASSLCELVRDKAFGITIYEDRVPVKPAVKGFCDMLGFDPLYVANEGKMLILASKEKSEDIVAQLRSHPLGREACCIGEVNLDNHGKVVMKTTIGGTRIVGMLSGDQLPRIC